MAKENKKQIQSTSPQVIVAASIMLVIAAIAVGYFGLYEPASEKLDTAKRNLQSAQSELDSLRDQEAQYNALKKENDRLESRLGILRDKIPSTDKELNHFFNSVNERARSSRISNWTVFKSEGIINNGEISTIPIRIEFTAAYDAALQFFWDLASMGDGIKGNNREQLINVHDLAMTRENKANETEPQVRVTFVAETYLYRGLNNDDPADSKNKKSK